ncbi:hypothetical protein HanIR_Chr13g0635381 [Helianthus annuus]|nr:hypothetical protein HanIR_Chr13g0635381 [Helianthus annuus]
MAGSFAKLIKLAEDHYPLMSRSLNFDTPVITSQHFAAPDVQYQGASTGMRFGSSVMSQARGSSFQPSGSSFQHQGFFTSLGGCMGTQPIQGSSSQAGAYNKNVRIRKFQVGDMVLRKAFQNTTNPADGKLAPKWEGPYLIEAEAGKGAYRLLTMEGDLLPRAWNVVHLKKYFM